jgi:hypothetical protein
MGRVFSDTMRRCVSAFEQKAHELYAKSDVYKKAI